MIDNPAAKRRANAETPRQGVALRGPAAASDYYELLPHGLDTIRPGVPNRGDFAACLTMCRVRARHGAALGS